ncbi:DNA repair protein XRCC2 isoform X1 [Bufo bufo]|uniref:DNA repair protein XRCC2 isoform X1 n=2 Tax=Bufo bufo TaxID=8384 RepID=UPI001ABE4F4D|nr:DNA repair protein XRCC2 isoform X1 [Bufo bufo]
MNDDFRRAESGTQLLARLEGRASLKELEPLLFASGDCPLHGDIIEFHGPEGSGKTEMFCHLISRCILPTSDGGLQVEVVYIDTDYHFDMLRLVTILEHRLSQSDEETIKQCLSRFSLVYCSSSVQLLLTLHSLENMFCSRPSLCLLIIDSLSSFYWIDRNNGGETVSRQEFNIRKCIELLEKLIKEYKLVLFASTQTLMQKTYNENNEASHSEKQTSSVNDYRPYLCKLWQHVTTNRVFFSKEQTQGSNSTTFSLTSCHLKSKNVIRRSFVITEAGAKFIL